MKRTLLLVLALLVVPQFVVAGSQTYSSPGTYTFTVPSSYSTLTVTVNGAGGGGGGPYLHPGGSSFPGQSGGASSIAAWSLYGYGGGGGGTVRYNTYSQEDGNFIGYDQSGSDGAAGTASGGTTNTTGGGGVGGGRWYPLPCGYDYAAGNSCEVHSGAGGAGGKAITTYTAGDLGAPAADSQVSVVVGSGGSVGQYAYPGFPLPSNGSAGSVVITWTDNQAPAAPSISGPTSGELDTSYTYTFDATDPESDTIRYAIDWNSDGSVDEYAPALGYVSSGSAASTTHSWSTTGSKTFKAKAQDSVGNSSGWTTYTVIISEPAPVVLLTASPSSISTGQSSTLTWSSAYADSCSATNFTMPVESVESGTPTIVTLTSGASWTVPSDWNSSHNTIEVIGGGGGGGGATASTYGAAGGGGAYSKEINASLTAGESVTYAIGVGGSRGVGANSGTSGGDTFICDSTTGCSSINGSHVVVGAKGGGGGSNSSSSPLAGAGGAAALGVGSTRYAGGSGGSGSGGSGGGGAAGPHGSGAPGGTSNINGSDNYGAGGGGGGGGGSAGANNATPQSQFGGSGGGGGNGGSNHSGDGSGAGGSSTGVSGTSGTNGGGGGGGGYEAPGGSGGIGTEWSAAYGSGGGGGGGGNSRYSAPAGGGSGGNYGGGGGSAGHSQQGGSANGGNGAQGLIVITYYALTASGTTAGSLSVSPDITTTYTVTCTGPNGSGEDTATVTYTCTPTNQCSGGNVVNSCTGAIVQSCSYGCGSGACVAPPPPSFNSGPDGLTGHLQARPVLVAIGASSRLYWDLSDVETCSVTGDNGDSWSGVSSGANGKTTSAISHQTVYTLSCTGTDDSSINETETVQVVPVYQEL